MRVVRRGAVREDLWACMIPWTTNRWIRSGRCGVPGLLSLPLLLSYVIQCAPGASLPACPQRRAFNFSCTASACPISVRGLVFISILFCVRGAAGARLRMLCIFTVRRGVLYAPTKDGQHLGAKMGKNEISVVVEYAYMAFFFKKNVFQYRVFGLTNYLCK